jgi:cytochrome c7-like protein
MTSPRLLPILLLVLPPAVLSGACSSDPAPPPSTTTAGAPTDPPPTAPPSKTPALRDGVDETIKTTLTGAGLDVANLPDELKDAVTDRAKTRAVMKTFTIALGVECNHCHAPKAGSEELDYEANTPQKNVARKMWTNFVRGLSRKDGSALYCDGCHQGKAEFLDRADDKALGGWMKENFVAKLARRDGQDHSCKTCHGDPFDGDLLEKWRQ